MPAATSKTTAKTTTAEAKQKAEETVSTQINDDAMLATADNFANAAREQMETLMTAFTGNADDMREKAEALNEEFRARFEKTQQHVSEMNNELMEAARTEMSDAVQFANDLTQAKSVGDALEIQRGYFSKLFETRIERAREIAENSVALARETAAPANNAFAPYFDPKAFEKFFPFSVKA